MCFILFLPVSFGIRHCDTILGVSIKVRFKLLPQNYFKKYRHLLSFIFKKCSIIYRKGCVQVLDGTFSWQKMVVPEEMPTSARHQSSCRTAPANLSSRNRCTCSSSYSSTLKQSCGNERRVSIFVHFFKEHMLSII